MLAVGPFKVVVGGIQIPMISQGGNAYAGDITSFANTTAELRIISGADVGQIQGGPEIDNIVFSSNPVPEPSSFALMFLGIAWFFKARRK
jgi:hypothetical protein